MNLKMFQQEHPLAYKVMMESVRAEELALNRQNGKLIFEAITAKEFVAELRRDHPKLYRAVLEDGGLHKGQAGLNDRHIDTPKTATERAREAMRKGRAQERTRMLQERV